MDILNDKNLTNHYKFLQIYTCLYLFLCKVYNIMYISNFYHRWTGKPIFQRYQSSALNYSLDNVHFEKLIGTYLLYITSKYINAHVYVGRKSDGTIKN